MRRLPAGVFDRLSAPEALWQAWRQASRGKRRHPAVARFDRDADRAIFALSRQLTSGRYRPSAVSLREVRDPKRRIIAAPAVRDRVVHRALVDAIGPHFEHRYIAHSYAGIPGRGQHRAVLYYLGAMRRHRFVLHLDIAAYFRSVPIERLQGLLLPALRDPRLEALVERVLIAGAHTCASIEGRDPGAPARGLALGSLVSQWAGNVYLDGLDHYVKRELAVGAYLRYMDDFVLFGDQAEALVDQRDAIARWLWRERGLTLHPGHLEVRHTRDSQRFLGRRVSRAGITPSRNQRQRAQRKIRAAADHGPEALARTLASYRGAWGY